jgi:hypothetical protein
LAVIVGQHDIEAAVPFVGKLACAEIRLERTVFPQIVVRQAPRENQITPEDLSPYRMSV